VAIGRRAGIADSLPAFAKWLAEHPVEGDCVYGSSSVRYQVARYYEYLDANPWPGGDPLHDPRQRNGAMNAYRIYLDTFNTPAATISQVQKNLDHLYAFLDLSFNRRRREMKASG
jgi:hypothetical protein